MESVKRTVRFTENYCVECRGRVPKGRHYTCSYKCKDKHEDYLADNLKRRKERMIKTTQVKVGVIQNAIKWLFG